MFLMQYTKGYSKRKKWENKPCDHPRIAKETFLGVKTGGYLCTQCGKEFTKAGFEKLFIKKLFGKQQF